MPARNNSIQWVVFGLLFASFACIGSIYIATNYVFGDIEKYAAFYNDLNLSNILGSFRLYIMHIGAAEPGFFWWSVLAKTLGFDFEFYRILNNLIFSFAFFLFLKRLSCFKAIVVLLACSFYFIVLVVELERLKLAISLIMMGLASAEGSSKRRLLLFLSILFHVQVLLFLIIIFLEPVRHFLSSLVVKFKIRLLHLSFILVIMGLAVVVSSRVIEKIISYGFSGDLIGFFVCGCMGAVAFFTRRKSFSRIDVLLGFAILSFAIFIFGGQRLNILVMFIFVYFAPPNAKNIIIYIALITYFSNKSIVFLGNFMETGRGYS